MNVLRFFLRGSFLPGFCLLGIACAGGLALQAQQAASPAKPAESPSVLETTKPSGETVVALVDGEVITSSQLQGFLAAMPPQNRAAATKDPESFLRQFALMNKLAKFAEERKLHERSPYKEQLAYQRALLLSTAGLNMMSQELPVTGAEAEEYYNSHKEDFTQVATKVIYLPFSNVLPEGGAERKSLTESAALELANKLVAELRAGADFVAMVKKHSKDEASAAKDGDFATLKKSDSIPENVKAVVFALKEGQISDPVRQPNGFYIFRAEKVTVPSYPEVAATINSDLHDEKFRNKMDAMRNSIRVEQIRPELIK